MTSRIEAVRPASSRSRLPFRPRAAAALRETWRSGYGRADLRADLLAGLVVGMVALPLSMALAVASGVPPQHGLYTAIVAGGLIALLGGSRVQVSGPTAAFVVILAPISAQYGVAGLAVASALAGVLLIAMSMARLGRLIEFIPYPVTTGFTAGIAVVIATLQVRDFLGLDVAALPEHYVEKVRVLVAALPSVSWADVAVGVLTLVVLLGWPRVTKRVPAALVALPLAAVAPVVAGWLGGGGFEVATIGSRFNWAAGGETGAGIPALPPMFVWPWELPGADGPGLAWSWAVGRDLLVSACAIAMLGAIESLLSAVVADGMTGRRHDPDSELLAQGVGNVVAPFFGGFAATGAIARTAANIRSGARSPIASIVHAGFILLSVLTLAPLLGYLPMAALAALLLVVAKNMSEARHAVRVLRIGPRSDAFVLVLCFVLTVVFDMVVAVGVGVVMASVLFMRRMAEVGGVELVTEAHPDVDGPLPAGVVVYRVAGPLFFGAAQKAMSALETVDGGVRTLVLDLEAVPVIDATGLVNLESALARLQRDHVQVVLAGVQRQPAEALERAGVLGLDREVAAYATLAEALAASGGLRRVAGGQAAGVPADADEVVHI